VATNETEKQALTILAEGLAACSGGDAVNSNSPVSSRQESL
jgi:hypothetical protein